MGMGEHSGPAGRPAVAVEELSYRYGDGSQALDRVSLRIEEGESVCLIGPNGAGKTTLLMHLIGVLPRMEGGRIRIAGMPAVEPHLKEIRRRIGMVFQDPDDQLFCPTVFEDVAFGLVRSGLQGEELDDRIRRALECVGIPPQWKSRAIHHLSLGEKKRVALATVLAMDASILVMDEPSSNLDPAGRRSLIHLLNGLPLTKLIATHDLEMARQVCGRAILLSGGRVAADGPADAVMGDEGLMLAHRLEVPLTLRLRSRGIQI